MFSKQNRPYIVVGILVLSYLLAAAAQDQFSDSQIQIDGKIYEVLSVRKTGPQFGVVEEGGLFKHVSLPTKFQIRVATSDSEKWIEVDESAYAMAINKLKSLGY